MSEATREFEERLARMQPRRISVQMRNAVEERLVLQPKGHDWPMVCAMGSGLAAACVIAAMLVVQTPSVGPRSFSGHLIIAATPQDPRAIYAFNFATNSLPDDGRRVR